MKRKQLDVENFGLAPGERLNRNPKKPVISIVRNGGRTYLWVGNDAPDDKFCFAILGGVAHLRRLANVILEEVGK